MYEISKTHVSRETFEICNVHVDFNSATANDIFFKTYYTFLLLLGSI